MYFCHSNTWNSILKQFTKKMDNKICQLPIQEQMYPVDDVSQTETEKQSHMDAEHSREEPQSFNCKDCEFKTDTQSKLDEHMITKQAYVPNCMNCVKLTDEVTVLKVKLDSLDEVQEDYEVAKKMYLEKEKELEKSNEIHKKEMDKEGLDRMKLEDTVRRLTLENEKLKTKNNKPNML